MLRLEGKRAFITRSHAMLKGRTGMLITYSLASITLADCTVEPDRGRFVALKGVA